MKKILSVCIAILFALSVVNLASAKGNRIYLKLGAQAGYYSPSAQQYKNHYESGGLTYGFSLNLLLQVLHEDREVFLGQFNTILPPLLFCQPITAVTAGQHV